MLTRNNSSSGKHAAISLKMALITAVTVAFGILHVAGLVLLHDAAGPRPTDTSEMMTNHD